MRKLLSIVLILCMVMCLSVSSFATTSSTDKKFESDMLILELSDKFDIKNTKRLYEEAGFATYEDLKIISDNVVSYKIDWKRIGVASYITEEILNDGRLKKTFVEGDLTNEVIYDRENGIMTIDGNAIDISEEIQLTKNSLEATPMAVPVWTYSSKPWGGTKASDYTNKVWSGYKNVQYGSFVQSLAVALVAERIASVLGGYSLVVTIASVGLDQMASKVKSASSPYSKTGKCFEVQKCIPSDVETRYRHTVDYYDDYDGTYLLTKDYYSLFV